MRETNKKIRKVLFLNTSKLFCESPYNHVLQEKKSVSVDTSCKITPIHRNRAMFNRWKPRIQFDYAFGFSLHILFSGRSAIKFNWLWIKPSVRRVMILNGTMWKGSAHHLSPGPLFMTCWNAVLTQRQARLGLHFHSWAFWLLAWNWAQSCKSYRHGLICLKCQNRQTQQILDAAVFGRVPVSVHLFSFSAAKSPRPLAMNVMKLNTIVTVV